MSKKTHVRIILPNNEEYNLESVEQGTLLRDLKFRVELNFGIPCEIQHLSLDGEQHFSEWMAIEEYEESKAIHLKVDLWWNKLIIAALNGDVENVYRRVIIPMQQVTKEERGFTAALIGVARKSTQLINRLITQENPCFDFTRSTRSGRNLFHIGACCGNENILKLLLEKSQPQFDATSEMLTARDVMGKCVLDIAKENQNTACINLISSYLNNRSQKENRNATSGIHIDNKIRENTNEMQKLQDEKCNYVEETNDEHTKESGLHFSTTDYMNIHAVTTRHTSCEADIHETDLESHELKIAQEDPTTNVCTEAARPFITIKFPGDERNGCSEMTFCMDSNDSNFDNYPNSLISDNHNRSENNPANYSNEVEERQRSDHDADQLRSSPLLIRRNNLQGRVSPLCLPIMSLEGTPEEEIEVNGIQLPQIRTQPSSAGVNLVKKSWEEVSGDDGSNMKTKITLPSPPHEQIGKNRSQSAHHRRITIGPLDKPHLNTLQVMHSVTVDGNISNSRSAPNSPKLQSRCMTRAGSQSVPTSPRFRRCSLQFEPKSPNTRAKLQSNEKRLFERRRETRSMSMCEELQPHQEYLQWLEDIQKRHERISLPWNVWRNLKEASEIKPANTPHSTPLPNRERRKSFDVWFLEKERQKFLNSERHDNEGNSHEEKHVYPHGKTFEQWLQEKNNEGNIKEQEHDGRDNNRDTLVEKRRRESLAKYEKWLKEKDTRALEEEKKALEDEERKRLEAEKKLQKARQEREKVILQLENKFRKNKLGRTRSNPINHR